MVKGEVNVTELKSKLSEYLRSVRNGNEIIIKDRDTPIAKLVPYQVRKGQLAEVRRGALNLGNFRLPDGTTTIVCNSGF